MLSLVEALGLEAGCVPKMATGFGGGMARHGETCGALVGAIMALGLKYGRTEAADSQSKANAYAKVDMLLRAFQEEFGCLICRDLVGCDFRTPEGDERFKRENLHVNLCTKFVAFASREALRMMSDE